MVDTKKSQTSPRRMADLLPRLTFAKRLGVSPRTLDRYINEGFISSQKIIGKVYIPASEIKRLREHFYVQRDGKGPIATRQARQTRHGVHDQTLSTQLPIFLSNKEKNDDQHSITDQRSSIAPAEPENAKDLYTPSIREKYESDVHDSHPKKENVVPHTFLQQEISYYQTMTGELREELQEKERMLQGANYRVGQLEAKLTLSVPLLDHQKALSEHKSAYQRWKEERLNKWVYFALLIFFLVLQPVLFFLTRTG